MRSALTFYFVMFQTTKQCFKISFSCLGNTKYQQGVRHCTPLTYTLPCADTDRNKQRHSHQRNANNRQPVCSCWWLFTTVVYIVTFPRSLTQKSKHKHTLLHTAPALNYVRFDTGCQKTQSRFHFSSSSSVFLTVCPKLCALTITRKAMDSPGQWSKKKCYQTSKPQGQQILNFNKPPGVCPQCC